MSTIVVCIIVGSIYILSMELRKWLKLIIEVSIIDKDDNDKDMPECVRHIYN